MSEEMTVLKTKFILSLCNRNYSVPTDKSVKRILINTVMNNKKRLELMSWIHHFQNLRIYGEKNKGMKAYSFNTLSMLPDQYLITKALN